MTIRGQRKPIDECVVLYVEDDDAAVYLFQIALREANVFPQLFRVTDGEQAAQFLSRVGLYESAPAPDLVVLDLNLPRKSGFEVLAEIRENPHLCTLPVVVLSTSMNPYDRKRAIQLRASDYFVKPSDFYRLLAIAASIARMLPIEAVLKSA